MNKLLSAILLLTLSGISLNGLADHDEEDEDEFEGGAERVVICHRGRNTLTVGAPALGAHLGHGDTQGRCEDDEGPGEPDEPERPDDVIAVVMMHCEAVSENVQVTAFSSSVDFDGSTIMITDDCADTLAALINGGFHLRSVTGATDYLLLGEVPDS